MQDFEELFQSTRSAIDSLKDGLQSISDEEHQLLMLRNQLTKIKKIREEQHKKDSLIAALKERIAVLEHSLKGSEKQSAEVCEIMRERIVTLERYVSEKEVTERELRERVWVLEEGTKQTVNLEEQLHEERKKSAHWQTQYERAAAELQGVKLTVSSDKQLYDHMHTLFQSLRDELDVKDAELS
eukprot:gene7223-8949_t